MTSEGSKRKGSRRRPREASGSEHEANGARTEAPSGRAGLVRGAVAGRGVLSLGLVIVAALLGVAAWRVGASPNVASQSSGRADIGGPFHLVDQDARATDQRVLLGRWSAVFFGYTYCPDTCPATLQALGAAQARLAAPQRKAFQVVFISVDPARDTPAQMKLYLTSQGFPSRAIGLTGTPAEVANVARAYHAIYARQGSGPDYLVQHSAAVYLMNPQGQFVKPLDETQPPRAIADQIKEAMAG